MNTNRPPRPPRNNQEGAALMVAIIFLIVAGLTAAYITTRVVNHTVQVKHHINFQETFHGLEAGISQVALEISADEDGFIGIDPNFNFATGLPEFDDPDVTPIRLASNPEVEFFAYELDWAIDGRDNNGDGHIDSGIEVALPRVSQMAHARIVRNDETILTRRVEFLRKADEAGANSIWKYAIYAGSGQDGGVIHGNVAIHGSVHILGDSLQPGDLAISVMELGGTSLLHNNYEGMPNDLRWRIPPLPTTTVNGETVEYLKGTLHVKQGQVWLNGNSEVGQIQVAGSGIKGNMDGVYVNDGWGGNQASDGSPNNVYSDNGWDTPYDQDEYIPFPDYEDDGGRDHLDYYLDTEDALGHVYDGDMTIQLGGGNFYWNATTGEKVVDGTPGDGSMPSQVDLDESQYYVWFDDATDTMLINGRIPIDGDLNLKSGSGTNNETLNYLGKGSFLTHDSGGGQNANANIELNLVTIDYPFTNLIGIHAENDLTLGVLSQLDLMGGFYAQGTVSSDKQTNIIGTIIGDNFDLSGQVPHIFQVLGLEFAWEDNMRMIGSRPIEGTEFENWAWVEHNVL